MVEKTTGFGVLALVCALTLSAAAPASAEFFGGNGRQQVSYSTSRYTQEFAAQTARPRITIYPRQTHPGRKAKRQCRSWLAQEYRVSGTVIVPKTRCWWE